MNNQYCGFIDVYKFIKPDGSTYKVIQTGLLDYNFFFIWISLYEEYKITKCVAIFKIKLKNNEQH